MIRYTHENRLSRMIAQLRPRVDGDALLYRALLVLVLFSYGAPVYVAITQVLPHTSTVITWLLNVVALLVLLLTFKPVWAWVRPRVHHVVYAPDEASVEALAKINASLDVAHAQPSVLATVAETIARTMKLPYVAIETIGSDTARYGQPIEGGMLTHIELFYRDVSVGRLDVMGRLRNEPLTTGESRLLHSLARQVSITLHAAQLTDALQASREQLVRAREEERRRIRRDLHDGLGPTLASLRLQLSALRRSVRHDPDAAERLIDELRDDVRAATADIRRLVYDLRPPMLDEFGLIGALRHVVSTTDGLTRNLDVPETLPVLPAALEVAIYRVAAEALHNMVRHAHATHCTMKLEVNETNLTLTVMDNGCGLPATYLPGIGHQSMYERAAELGGTLTILATPTGGTSVIATFPLKAGADE